MSLIEEALRRVQDPVVKSMPWPTKSVPQPLAKTSPVSAWRKTSSLSLNRSLTLVAITVVILSVGLAVGAFFWGRKQAQATAAPAPIMSSSSLDGLIVTGVVEGFGEPYAVINGAIVAVGERIRDHTLLEITNGIVRLRRADGEEVALRVPR